MFDIKKGKLPSDALLQRYAETDGGYTDCYYTEIDGAISLSSFVVAFYTTWLFKIERFALKYLVSKPSTDRQAHELVDEQIEYFAAWRVEQRTNNQLLMRDFAGRTLSWFMIAPDLEHFRAKWEPVRVKEMRPDNYLEPVCVSIQPGTALDQDKDTTRLYFGAAIVPRAAREKQKPSIGFAFHAMMGFHQLYSRALLSTAKSRLGRTTGHRTSSFLR